MSACEVFSKGFPGKLAVQMKLHEYQSKDLLAKYGVPVAAGDVTSDPAEVKAIAERLGGNVVMSMGAGPMR